MIAAIEIYIAGVMIVGFFAGLLTDVRHVDPVGVIRLALSWPIVAAASLGGGIRGLLNLGGRK